MGVRLLEGSVELGYDAIVTGSWTGLRRKRCRGRKGQNGERLKSLLVIVETITCD